MDAVASAQFSVLMLRDVMHRDVHIQSTPRMIGHKITRQENRALRRIYGT